MLCSMDLNNLYYAEALMNCIFRFLCNWVCRYSSWIYGAFLFNISNGMEGTFSLDLLFGCHWLTRAYECLGSTLPVIFFSNPAVAQVRIECSVSLSVSVLLLSAAVVMQCKSNLACVSSCIRV